MTHTTWDDDPSVRETSSAPEGNGWGLMPIWIITLAIIVGVPLGIVIAVIDALLGFALS